MPQGSGAPHGRSPRSGVGTLLLPCLPRGAAAHSCVGGDFPPFPRGRDRAFRLTGNGAFEDYYSVQLQGGAGKQAQLQPLSLLLLIPHSYPATPAPGTPPQVSPDPSLVLLGRQGASSKVRGRVGDAGG